MFSTLRQRSSRPIPAEMKPSFPEPVIRFTGSRLMTERPILRKATWWISPVLMDRLHQTLPISMETNRSIEWRSISRFKIVSFVNICRLVQLLLPQIRRQVTSTGRLLVSRYQREPISLSVSNTVHNRSMYPSPITLSVLWFRTQDSKVLSVLPSK